MIFLFGKKEMTPLAADVVLRKIPAKVANRFLSDMGGKEYIVVQSRTERGAYNVSSAKRPNTSILILRYKSGLFGSSYLAITAKEYKHLAKKAVNYILDNYK
jgi:hypothetical protein